MTVTLEIPKDIEDRLRRENPNLDFEMREAIALALFRKCVLNHYELSCALGIDRFETDALLQRHEVTEQGLTAADLEADQIALSKLLGD